MSFGFSPGDVVMFGQFLLKVRGALKKDGGSRGQYLRAMKQCNDFDTVLDSIRRLDLSNATNSFKEQLVQCAFDTEDVINDFRQTVARYEKSMGKSASRGKFASAPRKIQWAFSAADDLDDFRKRLQSQIDRIQITLQGNLWEMMAKMERRTQILDGLSPTTASLLFTPMALSTRGNMQMASGSAVPPIWESVYREIHFMEDLLFRRFFSTELPLPIPEIGRSFTLPDDASDAVAVAAQPPLSIPVLQAPDTEENTDASLSINQHTVPAQPLGQNAGTDLRAEINELLRSLNLEELSPNEERQLPLMLQSHPKPPSTTESLASGTQPSTLGDEPSPAREEGSPPDEKRRKPRRFAMPRFSGFGIDSLSLAASLIQAAEFAAKLATQYRSLSSGGRPELAQLASTLSRASDVLRMMFEISQSSMSGRTQDLALGLVKESEEAVIAADNILKTFHFRPGSYTALSNMIKFQVNRDKVKNATQSLERLDGMFLFVLQIHQAEVTGPFTGWMRHLQDEIQNLRSELQVLLHPLGNSSAG